MSAVSPRCYISSDVVKLATTVGGFALVFVCNLGVLVVIVRLVLQLRLSGAPPGEKSKGGRMGRDACSLMAVSCMLGITWGLVFLSFSQLTLAGIYLFCILNSFQGKAPCVCVCICVCACVDVCMCVCIMNFTFTVPQHSPLP